MLKVISLQIKKKKKKKKKPLNYRGVIGINLYWYTKSVLKNLCISDTVTEAKQEFCPLFYFPRLSVKRGEERTEFRSQFLYSV